MRQHGSVSAGKPGRRWLFRIANHLEFTGGLALIAALAAVASISADEPYIPREDAEVLEVLPREILFSRDELATLRRQLANDPENQALAASVASRYLQLGKQESDPRFNGYAQAALKSWWHASNPPPEILKLRAKLKERDHLYDAAAADLQLVLQGQPRDVQAWIELANIYWVQGKYAEAQNACVNLSKVADPIETLICSVPVDSVTGKAEEAYASLTEILPTVRERWPAAVQWMLTMQAEIAQALGKDELAERHYRDGLAENPKDYYLLRAYADYLLDRGREEEVLSLLREHTVDTGILLAATIAARRSGEDALADEWQNQLKSRFDETRLRGDLPHGKFEARYELELRNDPKQALAVAAANWRLQKAPRDTRNLLEAAIAAKDPAAAEAALQFLDTHGTQDVVLQELSRKLERH